MKKVTLLFFALMSCFSVFAHNTANWGSINYQDADNNDISLEMKLTCAFSSCPSGIGTKAGPAYYAGWIKIQNLKIQDWNYNTRDITSSVPSNCLMVTAPQNLNIVVDNTGNVTSITCPQTK